MSVLDNE